MAEVGVKGVLITFGAAPFLLVCLVSGELA